MSGYERPLVCLASTDSGMADFREIVPSSASESDPVRVKVKATVLRNQVCEMSWYIIISGNGLSHLWRQAITWTYGHPSYGRAMSYICEAVESLTQITPFRSIEKEISESIAFFK